MSRQHSRREVGARVVSIVVVASAAACGGLLDAGGHYVACPSSDPNGSACTHAADECPRARLACDGTTENEVCYCTGQLLWSCPPIPSCSADADVDTSADASHDSAVDPKIDAAPPLTCVADGPTSCDVCVAKSCCDELQACNASPTCSQWKTCVENCESPTASAFACAESTCSGFHDQAEADLYTCATSACDSPCLDD